ncbi:DNA-binding protein [Pectobacterium versatile]|uniref:DNA-binding protein n=1 Tax=Pectobacterium versatile TaxID=2488639 RepID=UPI000F6543DC|nr:DNA-binding protein [Pectobacterium versatile]AZK65133.1 DNA-binding protein [Pectobacterium versatile]
MALVSISEASRLTNKSRTTVHRYISNGKLSTCTDENSVKKIDTSELLRVFGAFKAVHHEQSDNVTDEQHATPNGTIETSKTKQLEHEIEHLRQLVTAQQSHIESLKQAMLLIESKLPATQEPVKQPVVKKSWQFWKK